MATKGIFRKLNSPFLLSPLVVRVYAILLNVDFWFSLRYAL
jgi:hypothetical protein